MKPLKQIGINSTDFFVAQTLFPQVGCRFGEVQNCVFSLSPVLYILSLTEETVCVDCCGGDGGPIEIYLS